ncbi:hypothetical protein HMPREF9466_01695 [Fusobacterium necrophorum subsp. funduliforme 1_1_36S]|nr:hypothetical protein HMPREF9466_01695 [Fusobacterium necrophorum subsp. funduliforme 1_1_36S]
MPTSKELLAIENAKKNFKEKQANEEKNLQNNCVIGIDLSKSCPGIAIMDTQMKKLIYLDNYPNTKTTHKTDHERNIEIVTWLDRICNTFHPKTAIIESAHISSFTIKSAIPLLKLHGLIDECLLAKGMEIFEISPSSSRAFLKIKPNKKEAAFEWVKKKFPEAELNSFKKDNDKSDAIILVLNFLTKQN